MIEFSLKLLSMGYYPMPMKYHQGMPIPIYDGLRDEILSTRKEDLPTLFRSKLSMYRMDGIQIICSPETGLICLDYDNQINGEHEKIQRVLPLSPVQRRGTKGVATFYRTPLAGASKVTIKVDNFIILESVLLISIPPTKHKSGIDYTWLTDSTLYNTPLESLPVLRGDWEDLAYLSIGKNKPVPFYRNMGYNSFSDRLPDEERIKDALLFISPDVSRDDWVKVGMAIHSCGDSIDGYAIFDKWSSGGSSYDLKACRYTWKSFKDKKNTRGLGTLFYMAKQNGWVDTRYSSY